MLWLQKNIKQADSIQNEGWQLEVSQKEQNVSFELFLTKVETVNHLIPQRNERHELSAD